MKQNNCWLLLSLLFILFLNNSSFGQSMYWAEKAGSVFNDEGADISIDANGNTYTTGYFSGTAAFGTITLNSSGVTDIFITKTDSLGAFQWAVKAGSIGSDRGLSIKADAAGNCYVTGFYYGTANFGSSSITSSGLQDLFIAKYNTTGILQWVKTAGGAGPDIGNGINVDNAGNVLVTGEFKGTASFGSFPLTSMNNSIDVFIAKLDAAGNFLWAKQGAAPNTDRGIDVAADVAGNVYVTGTFSDTITFDATHYNTIHNAIFLIKYNSSGNEQWFKKIGGGTLNLVSGITVDASANVYLTGDFTGNLIFFGPPNTTITNTYSNRIFTARYDSGGNLIWADADGSDGEISSKNITVDASGNPYIIGNFKCILNDYADHYGQGTFNSIGFHDIFVTKYNTAGAWQWSRQYGGKLEDYGAGITVNSSGKAIITGSFQEGFIFPQPQIMSGYDIYTAASLGSYCSDPAYGYYNQVLSAGSSDIMIAKVIDLSKQTYDYYMRDGTGCSKPYEGVCIHADYNDVYSCYDSAEFCGQGELQAYSHTIGAGPVFTYLWSDGSTGYYLPVTASGYYSVTQTSIDGCFVSTDSIYVTVHPFPPTPTISDDHGINTNAINTLPVILCGGSVLLTGGGFGSNTYGWAGPTGSYNSTTDLATVTGYYSFYDTTVFGCVNNNTIWVVIDSVLPPIIPEMICLEDTDRNDSITLCYGNYFQMFVYDSISNPAGDLSCIPDATIYWSVSPDTSINFTNTTFPDCTTPEYSLNEFLPLQSGNYEVTAMVVRQTNCDVDTVYISRTIYVNLLPVPLITITGNPYICPGDSTLLQASGADTYSWQFSGAFGDPGDSIWASQPGLYYVSGTNSYGCVGGNIFYVTTYVPLLPVITMIPSSGLICPGDSVQFFCDGSGTFQWEGPSGPIGGNSSTVFANIPGIYYCVRTDTNGCSFANASNSLQINQYGTPYILGTPGTVLCPGGSVQISVVSSDTSNIQWQAPLNGNHSTQVVTSPGTYSCAITSCGIVTLSSVTITMSTVSAAITVNGSLSFCSGDSVLLTGNSGMTGYDWQPGSYSQPVFPVYQSGTYTLSTTDENGCSATSAPVTVNVTPSPSVSVNSPSVCTGSTVTLTASGSTNYLWSTGAVSATIILTPASSTTYTVSTTASGCTSSAISAITVNPIPVVSVNSPSVCSGQGATLTAIGASAYSWSTGDLTNPVIVYPSSASSYTVTGTSAGCSATATASVSVTPSPNVNVNSATICEGQTATLSVTGAASYLWSTGSIASAITVSPSATTSFSVSGTSLGCADTAISIVTVDPLPILAVNSPVICAGQTATITASGATTYLWSTGSVINSITVTPAATTSYSVTGNLSGCIDSTQVTVTVNPVPVITVNSPVICAGETATLSASGADSYSWSTGDLSSSVAVSPLLTTVYVVTGNTNGCSGSATSTVSVTPNTVLSPVVADTEICSGDAVTLIASGQGTMHWYTSANATVPVFSGPEFTTPVLSAATTYYVSAQDLNCRSTAIPVTVSIDDCDDFILPNSFTPNGDGINDVLFFHMDISRCFDCRIYNRWGTLIYEWENPANGWNGTIMKTNRPAADGVYYFILDYCSSGGKKELTGFIQLLRE